MARFILILSKSVTCNVKVVSTFHDGESKSWKSISNLNFVISVSFYRKSKIR